MGTWRLTRSKNTSISSRAKMIVKEKGLGDDNIVLSLDQRGNQLVEDSATLGALKIGHGGMLYAQFSGKRRRFSDVLGIQKDRDRR